MWLKSPHWLCCEDQCLFFKSYQYILYPATSKQKKLIDCAIFPEGKVNNKQKSKVKDDLMLEVFLGFV